MKTVDPIIAHKSSDLLIGYKYLVFFSMLHVSIMICNAILTNRYISLGESIFVLGGSFTSPLFFILGDITAEIFGSKVSKQMIWCGFTCLVLFSLVCFAVIHTPYPAFFKDQRAYAFIFSQLPYIVMSSFAAFIVSGFVNVHVITKWKVLLRGRYFWLRSLGSSTIAEALYSIIAIFMMEMGSIPLTDMWKIILVSYLIKVSYSILFAIPASILVAYIKNTTRIDVYDSQARYNPFNVLSVKKSISI